MMPVVMLATLLLAAGMAQAQSGNLEPPDSAVNNQGEPLPTTQTQPSWDQKLTGAERFKYVLGSQGVLDKETGLVWEQSPWWTGIPSTSQFTWVQAVSHCIRLKLGGRYGWHMPTIEQLASLIDDSQLNPTLPSGHPFSNVQSDYYWSATTLANTTTSAWDVHFGVGILSAGPYTNTSYSWCVRGGRSNDAI